MGDHETHGIVLLTRDEIDQLVTGNLRQKPSAIRSKKFYIIYITCTHGRDPGCKANR